MARNEQRRQKSLQKHAAKRKQKRHALVGSGGHGGVRAEICMAAHWPVLECLVSKDWEKEGEIANVVVGRKAADGTIAAGSFVVDLACLGVKDAFAANFASVADYETRMRAPLTTRTPMTTIDLDLAAKIVRDGVAYAKSLGFRPHKDYYGPAALLEGANPDAARKKVRVGGRDGKPHFIAGPYDNVQRVLALLERSLGADNYHFTVPVDQFQAGILLDDLDLEFLPVDAGEEDEALEVEYNVRGEDVSDR